MNDCKFSKRGIIPPIDGWKAQHVYLIEISFSSNNPIHRSLFYSGFLDNGLPGNYNAVWNPTYDKVTYREIYYMKVIQDLGPLFEEN